MRNSTLLLLAGVLCLGLQGCDRHGGGGIRGMFRGERGDRGGGHGLRHECRSELEQFCAADQKGRDRRLCLEQHRDKLSDDCKKALDQRGNRGGGGRRNRDKDGTTNDSGD